MNKHDKITAILNLGPVLPILTIPSLDKALPLARSLLEGGIKVIEVTLRTECSIEAIRLISNECNDLVVGAGTILTPTDAERAMAAGAKFLVSPGLTKNLALQDAGPLLPGVATPSEIMSAMEWGFTCFKLFPAVPLGGIQYLNGIAGPLPQAKFCPTCGINGDNAGEFLALKNVISVGGSWIAPATAIEQGRWAEITRLSSEAIAALPKKSI